MANNVTLEEHLESLASAIKKYADSRIATVSGGGASYILPTASTTVKGGIKVGTGLEMQGDTLNVTIDGGETYSEATTLSSGLMSSADKTKLNGIAANANYYTLPTASTDTKGGIKVGTGLSMNGDTLNCTLSGGATGDSTTTLVLSNIQSGNVGDIWFDIEVAQLPNTNTTTLPTLAPTPLVNGSVWLEL